MKRVFAFAIVLSFALVSVSFAASRVWVNSPEGKCSVWAPLVQSQGGGTYKVIYSPTNKNDGANCRNASNQIVHHFALGEIISNKMAVAESREEVAPAPSVEPKEEAKEEIAPAAPPSKDKEDEVDEETSEEDFEDLDLDL